MIKTLLVLQHSELVELVPFAKGEELYDIGVCHQLHAITPSNRGLRQSALPPATSDSGRLACAPTNQSLLQSSNI